ncbi:MAG: hypothetical protein AB8B68_05360 [Rickettsiaceae bacterium]
MEKETQAVILQKDKKEDKFSKLSLALKNNLLRRKLKSKIPKQKESKNGDVASIN